ncbi:methylase [Leptospira fluminis]|uniref:Methylase n=1 Tax=Leptospira fluminis TaxID=2484979 RepID=A0A4V3JEJ1_9LEPT|nr:N-6 DNA methylase [Leptospira fluminis]TGK18774.1 methylase [Leptospira fluminis]
MFIQPTENISLHTLISSSKELGQFFTPPALARIMVEWVRDSEAEWKKETPFRILDPAAGKGIFFSVFNRTKTEFCRPVEFHGWEIDPVLFRECERNLEEEEIPPNARFLNLGDFLNAEVETSFDAILCNPPYKRLSHSKLGNDLLKSFKEKTGVAIPGTANLYVFFLLKILSLLKEKGRAAVLLPYEFLNAGYGIPVKKTLLESGTLRRILLLDSPWPLFSGAVTSSCILFLENAKPEVPGFLWSRISSSLISEGIYGKNLQWRTASLKAEHKWTHSFREDREILFRIKSDAKIPYNNNYVSMSKGGRYDWVSILEFGKFRRGIATGDNGFFLLSEKEASSLKIPSEFLRSSIPKAQYALSPFFTGDDWDVLRSGGAKVWLLDAKEILNVEDHTGIRKYLEEGIRRGVPNRFLPSKRRPWHSQESREPSRILATSFHRQDIRFVLNSSPAVNLTCFHGFTAKPEYAGMEELLFAYLITPHAHKELESRTREYAQGLRKVEPGDLNSLIVPDLRKVKEMEKEKISSLLAKYRNLLNPWTPGRRRKPEQIVGRNPEEKEILVSIQEFFL